MESVRKRDEIWVTEQSAIEPIVWSDSEDCVVSVQEEVGDQKIHDPVPSALPDPFLENKLCLVCVRCPRAGLIEYPSGYSLSDKIGLTIYNQSSLATTICRTCYNKQTEKKTEDELIDMMKAIKISPSHFSFGGVYKSMTPTTTILTHEDGIAYIPLKLINNVLDDSCVLKSMIESDDEYIVSDLRGGFF
jgi:hypothetical protein